ncbi:MAG: YdcF family protein [Acidobacteria bacterium]|nr:YdcF family protein [Acidobacteriota bacterium]
MSASSSPVWTTESWALLEAVWQFMQLSTPLEPADVMLVLGTNDLRVADHAAGLYHQGLAPLLVFTGGIAHTGDLLATGWDRPEAEVFAERCRQLGVPESAVLLEPEARNTAENFRFSRALLARHGLVPRRILVAVKPFMQRRAMAHHAVEWPEVPATTSSWPGTFAQYCTPDLPADKIGPILLGDLQRLWIYAARGWSAPVEIPAEVRQAFSRLVELGFTQHLLADA